jgi:hypothetical protein
MKDSRSLISYSHRSFQRGPKLHNIHLLRVSLQIIIWADSSRSRSIIGCMATMAGA